MQNQNNAEQLPQYAPRVPDSIDLRESSCIKEIGSYIYNFFTWLFSLCSSHSNSSSEDDAWTTLSSSGFYLTTETLPEIQSHIKNRLEEHSMREVEKMSEIFTYVLRRSCDGNTNVRISTSEGTNNQIQLRIKLSEGSTINLFDNEMRALDANGYMLSRENSETNSLKFNLWPREAQENVRATWKHGALFDPESANVPDILEEVKRQVNYHLGVDLNNIEKVTEALTEIKEASKKSPIIISTSTPPGIDKGKFIFISIAEKPQAEYPTNFLNSPLYSYSAGPGTIGIGKYSQQ